MTRPARPSQTSVTTADRWLRGSGVNGSLNIGNGTRGDTTEDPVLWKGRRGFHALMHTQGDLTHAWSRDGLSWCVRLLARVTSSLRCVSHIGGVMR